MKARIAAFLTILVLCGCTSFEVSLIVPDVQTADVAFYANAVESVEELETGAIVSRSSRALRIKLKEGRTSFSLPFEPAEMLVSVRTENAQGMVHVQGSEDTEGATVYKARAMTDKAAGWKVNVTRRPGSGIEITISTGK